MANPQNPELRRSEESPRPRPDPGPEPRDVTGEGGPVPPDNQPGHHPPQDQDKPPADKFAEALGIKSDTELEQQGATGAATTSGAASAEPSRPKRRAAKKAPGAKAASTRAGAGPAGAPAAAPSRGRAGKGAAQPAASASGAAASSASSARVGETAEEAAELHHHKLPDDQLPHDTGLVTPAGTPVTARAFNWPLRYCGTVLKTSGTAIAAYGKALRELGERIMPGRH